MAELRLKETGIEQSVVCVVGPTASGKSELAQRIACEIDGEVVSADSMQVYRGMDIGTGKVAPDERRVPHHGLDLAEPGEPFSAALFQSYARLCFSDIEGRGRRSILCGGTGFYIRAAIDDYDFPKGKQVDNPVRDHYLSIARERGAHQLWLLLENVDPDSARIIPENDVKRVVRAFELLEEGRTYAQQKEALAKIRQCVPAVFIGLAVDVDVLKTRIDQRVDHMFEQGLVEEVEGLLEAGFREGVTAPQAIGYKEVVDAIEGRSTFDQARDAIKLATRRYAKRQRTWFRKDRRIHWIDATRLNFDFLTEEARRLIAKIDAD